MTNAKTATPVTNVFDRAIEAGAAAMYAYDYPETPWAQASDDDHANYWFDAELMIVAAMPHIRDAIAGGA